LQGNIRNVNILTEYIIKTKEIVFSALTFCDVSLRQSHSLNQTFSMRTLCTFLGDAVDVIVW